VSHDVSAPWSFRTYRSSGLDNSKHLRGGVEIVDANFGWVDRDTEFVLDLG
jgi:hypothetical protein